MEMKADSSHVLMSDVLKGQVPALESERTDLVAQEQGKFVVVVAHRVVAGKEDAIVGVLRGMLLSESPEIEFRCELGEALATFSTEQLTFAGFELHHGENTVINVPGPFSVKARRIDEISAADQMCTLGFHLVITGA